MTNLPQKIAERCRGNSQHPACKPTFFCLHPDCENRRLLCNLCVEEERHIGHKISYISDRIDPFSRLAANAYTPQARQTYNSLHKKAIHLDASLEALQQQVSTIFNTIRKKLIMPVHTVAGTYSNQMMKDALHTILERPTQYKQIQMIAERINYLLEHQHTPTDLNYFDSLERQADKILKETGQQVKMALKDMQMCIDQLQGVGKLNSKNLGRFGGFKNKDAGSLIMPKISEEQMQLLLKLQNSVSQNSINASQNSFQVKQEHIKPSLLEQMQAEIPQQKQKLSKSKSKKAKPKQSQIQKSFYYAEKQSKKAYSIKPERLSKRKPLVEQSAMPSEVESMARQLESSPLIMQPEEEMNSGSFQEWTVSPVTPISNLLQSKYKYIKTLRIDKLESQPKQLLARLRKMTRLQTLVVFEGFIADEHNIIELVKSLPKSIKNIILNCSNDFNRQCIEAMKEKFLDNLEMLEYYYDIRNHLRDLDESLYFRLNEHGIRIEPMQYENSNYLAQCFPKLKTCWLKAKMFKPGRKSAHINYSQLQSLVVGELEDTNSSRIEVDIVNVQLSSAILNTTQLRSLVLLGLLFEPVFFQNLITKNIHLETIHVQLCQGATEAALAKLTTNPSSKLKNFSIKDCPEIKGSFIQNVAMAEIFIMDHATVEKGQETSLPFKSFERCESFIYFNLFGHAFMSDSLLGSLKNSRNMKSLNIGCTCITDACVPHFSNFPELTTLILDENTISAQALYNICSVLPKLQKLSICGFNGQKNKGELSVALLRHIGIELPMLRHLSIRGCCEIGEGLELSSFPSLKVVELDKKAGAPLISTLKCAGVKVIEENDSEC